MRVAVVGSGIAGMGAAWLLSESADTHVFEIEPRMGGHSHTVTADTAEGPVPVDTGFIVFNNHNYPNLVGLFDALGVATEDTDMSFGVSIGPGRIEYEGSIGGLLAQPGNLLKASYWQMLADLVRFYRTARHRVAAYKDGESLAEFIAREGYGKPFLDQHLLPMAAAIWSCPLETMLEFPARSFIAFLENHQLMNFIDRPQWRTVSGGSREYVKKIAAKLGDRVHLNTTITGITRKGGGVSLTIAGEGEIWFDRVILAGHADQMLPLITDAADDERQILGAFDFQPNRVILHSDPVLMPERHRAWASWSYLTRERIEDGLCVTYWMNRLQNLKCQTPLFVTLNPFIEPSPHLIHGEYCYSHPVFDGKAIRAQAALPQIQGRDGLYFAGAWTKYGFHEDGLASAVAVAKSLGVPIPWASPTAAWHSPQGHKDVLDHTRKPA